MSSTAPKIKTKAIQWTQNMRPRVGVSVSYLGFLYINTTGKNAVPGSTVDWLNVGFDINAPLNSGDNVFNRLVTDTNNDQFIIVSGTFLGGDQDKLESYSKNSYTRQL